MTHSCPTRRSSDLMEAQLAGNAAQARAKDLQDIAVGVADAMARLAETAQAQSAALVGMSEKAQNEATALNAVAEKATASIVIAGDNAQERSAQLSAAAGSVVDRTLELRRSEEQTSELQSLTRNYYAVLCLPNKN